VSNAGVVPVPEGHKHPTLFIPELVRELV